MGKRAARKTRAPRKPRSKPAASAPVTPSQPRFITFKSDCGALSFDIPGTGVVERVVRGITMRETPSDFIEFHNHHYKADRRREYVFRDPYTAEETGRINEVEFMFSRPEFVPPGKGRGNHCFWIKGKDEDKVLALRAAAANPAMSDADFAAMARGLAIPDKPDTGPRVHRGVRSSHLKADYDPAMAGGVEAMTAGLYNAPAGAEGFANAIVDAAGEVP